MKTDRELEDMELINVQKRPCYACNGERRAKRCTNCFGDGYALLVLGQEPKYSAVNTRKGLDIKRVLSLYDNGYARKQIAEIVDCNINTLYKLFREHRPETLRRNRPWTEEEVKTVMEMRRNGASYCSIGKTLNRNSASIRLRYLTEEAKC